jgi:hypothetical protein
MDIVDTPSVQPHSPVYTVNIVDTLSVQPFLFVDTVDLSSVDTVRASSVHPSLCYRHILCVTRFPFVCGKTKGRGLPYIYNSERNMYIIRVQSVSLYIRIANHVCVLHQLIVALRNYG